MSVWRSPGKEPNFFEDAVGGRRFQVPEALGNIRIARASYPNVERGSPPRLAHEAREQAPALHRSWFGLTPRGGRRGRTFCFQVPVRYTQGKRLPFGRAVRRVTWPERDQVQPHAAASPIVPMGDSEDQNRRDRKNLHRMAVPGKYRRFRPFCLIRSARAWATGRDSSARVRDGTPSVCEVGFAEDLEAHVMQRAARLLIIIDVHGDGRSAAWVDD